MASAELQEYFEATEFRETRADLKLGVRLVEGPRIAIDCGCGAGSDIAYLRDRGFSVHAFDIEKEAIARCRKRFGDDTEVNLYQDSFNTFIYPSSSLILAESSLFFCPESDIDNVLAKINNALLPGGVFVASFLGQDDFMADPECRHESFWPDVLVTSEEELRCWLREYKIASFTEHRIWGTAVGNKDHRWHIYSVVARKP